MEAKSRRDMDHCMESKKKQENVWKKGGKCIKVGQNIFLMNRFWCFGLRLFLIFFVIIASTI